MKILLDELSRKPKNSRNVSDYSKNANKHLKRNGLVVILRKILTRPNPSTMNFILSSSPISFFLKLKIQEGTKRANNEFCILSWVKGKRFPLLFVILKPDNCTKLKMKLFHGWELQVVNIFGWKLFLVTAFQNYSCEINVCFGFCFWSPHLLRTEEAEVTPSK